MEPLDVMGAAKKKKITSQIIVIPVKEEDEVEEGRYWPLDEIEANIGKDVFTPNFEGEFRRIRKSLEALL